MQRFEPTYPTVLTYHDWKQDAKIKFPTTVQANFRKIAQTLAREAAPTMNPTGNLTLHTTIRDTTPEAMTIDRPRPTLREPPTQRTTMIISILQKATVTMDEATHNTTDLAIHHLTTVDTPSTDHHLAVVILTIALQCRHDHQVPTGVTVKLTQEDTLLKPTSEVPPRIT
jgi:hypothetical protein